MPENASKSKEYMKEIFSYVTHRDDPGGRRSDQRKEGGSLLRTEPA